MYIMLQQLLGSIRSLSARRRSEAMRRNYEYPICSLCEYPHKPMREHSCECDPEWWACGWQCRRCGGGCIHIVREWLHAGRECQLCQQISKDWQEHQKRKNMQPLELLRYQMNTSTFDFELDLFSNRRMKVVARGIHGRDYFEHCHHRRWNGMHRIVHVAAAVFVIAKCSSGNEILMSKDSELLSYDARLEHLCDSSRQLELNIVIK